MENVLLARVDDRLIHGQVMTAWMKLLPAKEIIVIDNKVAKDEFMITVLEMAAPTGVKVKVFTEEKAAEVLQAGLSKPTILLAKSPVSYKGGEFLLFFLYGRPSRLYGCGRYSTECGQS